MIEYATVEDINALKRELTAVEQERAQLIIPLVCASLRYEARKVGKNLDDMISMDSNLAEVAKSVTVDVVMRELMTDNSAGNEPMTQFTQSALGYSQSGTYLIPGGGLYIKNSELKRLGLKRQKYGVIEWYD